MVQVKARKSSLVPRLITKYFVELAFSLVLVIIIIIYLKSEIEVSSERASTLDSKIGTTNANKSLSGYHGETISIGQLKGMPAMGYGTCCRRTAKGDDIYQSTLVYLKLGGRLIDTAMAYGNHGEIGKSIRDSGIERKEIWITSKIAVNKVKGKGIQGTFDAVKSILYELGVGSYLDLCLIHTQKLGKEETIQMWKGLIKAQNAGMVRSIGVSNFNRHEILDLQTATGVLPELNQIQYHPWTLPEWKELVRWQTKNGIATTAYNSLGGSRFHITQNKLLKWPPILTNLAERYLVTEAQVLLRWALNQNVAVIPGATSEEHIRENLNIPNFDLTDEEIEDLEKAGAPEGWWDLKRGPVKYPAEEANRAWKGDHTIGRKS